VVLDCVSSATELGLCLAWPEFFFMVEIGGRPTLVCVAVQRRSRAQSSHNKFRSRAQGLEFRGGDGPASAPYNAEVELNFRLA